MSEAPLPPVPISDEVTVHAPTIVTATALPDQPKETQWLRKVQLIVLPASREIESLEHAEDFVGPPRTGQGLDLSDMHFAFRVEQMDTSAPNNAAIRIFNLSDSKTRSTVNRIRGEFSRVVLSAGYVGGSFGVIFDGTIKQFRRGRLSATDSYFDILAADGDIGYTNGVSKHTWGPGTTVEQMVGDLSRDMGMPLRYVAPELRGINPVAVKGKIGFGMARDIMSNLMSTIGYTWSIQNGQIQIIPLEGYLPDEAVEINSATGMIGIPEQTDQGVNVRALLNPKLRIGATIVLNNKDINELILQNPSAIVPYNQWTGFAYATKLAEGEDGLYRVYIAEHSGDTRGQEWYTDLTCLAIDPTSGKVLSG